MAELMDIFYLFKNETGDRLTDSELLNFMREQFDGVCVGELDCLRDTCLERLALAVRSGSQCKAPKQPGDEYMLYDGKHDYEALSEKAGWDRELYELCLGNME